MTYPPPFQPSYLRAMRRSYRFMVGVRWVAAAAAGVAAVLTEVGSFTAVGAAAGIAGFLALQAWIMRVDLTRTDWWRSGRP